MRLETILSTISCGVIIAYFVFIARFWFRSTKAYSELVKYEYENFRDQWLKDGEPIGIVFWKPKTPYKNFILKRATLGNPGIRMLILLFHTPKWIKEDPEAQLYLRNLRRNTLWWNISVLGLVMLFIIILLASSLWSS